MKGNMDMFELDLRSRTPIYEQLMDKIKEAVVYGILQPDEQLPPVRILSAQLTVNPNTVQKAYRELERMGYIYSLPGKGSFVAPAKRQAHSVRIDELRRELSRLFTEAVYLGLSLEEISILFRNAESLERGDSRD